LFSARFALALDCLKRPTDHHSDNPAVGWLTSKDSPAEAGARAQGLSESRSGQPSANRLAGIARACRFQGWLAAVFLAAITLIAYLPVWRAGFIWDDDTFLTDNPLIKQANGLYQFWCTAAAPDYFPATSTTLWLEWRLWGAHALGYHLVNVLLHALSAVLWWRVLTRLKIPGAWLAAAVFALHPVNVESVAWITERKNTLAMLFFVLTLLWYLRFEDTGRRRWYGMAVGAFVLALLSKTAVAPLPLVLLGLAWWRRGRVERRDLWRSVLFFAVAAVLALVTIWFQNHRAIGTEIVRADSFGSRLAGAGWAVWFYLYKALLPLNLLFVYPRWRIEAANVLSYVPGLLVVAGLVVSWCQRRSWGKVWFLGLGYFVLLLLPVLGFINIYFMRYSLVADHWQYFSIIGPVTLVAAGMTTALDRFAGRQPFLKPALCGVLLLGLGVLTWRQCGMYADVEMLWQTTIAGNAGCYLACNNLGTILLQKGQVDQAIAYFQRALEIQPDYLMAHLNLGSAFSQKGEVDKAITQFQKVLEIQPGDAKAHSNLGMVLLQKGRVDEAMVHLQKALEIEPNFAEAQNNLGWGLFQVGQLDKAIRHLQRALEIQPGLVMAHLNLGTALIQKGRVEEGIVHFQKAVELKPADAQAHNDLANALLQTGQVREALAHYQKSLESQPNNPQILANLAWMLATCREASVRNGTGAVELAQRANQLSGGQDAVILRTLAAAYAEAGRFAEAIATAQRARQLATAQNNPGLANALQAQLGFYQAGTPFHDAGPTSPPAPPGQP
jgi:tetratricopeptide (TPR) repeat protein